jgi:hypothetical protein
MREGCVSPLAVSLVCLLVCGNSRSAETAGDQKPEDEAVARAVRLLPRQPEKVTVVDVDNTPVLKEKLGRTEGFVTHGIRVVYLRQQGLTLQHAVKRGGVFDYALAAIIWHEMAHIDGAKEPDAQRQEELLWRQFILQRRVAGVTGLAYLASLQRRHLR